MTTSKHRYTILGYSILAIVIYCLAIYKLTMPPDLIFIMVLSIPCLYYFWRYNKSKKENNPLRTSTSLILIIYAIVYFIAIYVVNFLGSSAALWLVQFILPLLILVLSKQNLSTINFRWSDIFKGFRSVLLCCLVLVPYLIFNVRDTEKLLPMLYSGKLFIFFPLSVMFMFISVAFWEEFFFRGVLLQSMCKLTSSGAASIFWTSIMFGIYHLPMRYLNVKSPTYGNFLDSMASTLNEQFILGLLLGILVWRSRNIWHGVWLHSILNGLSGAYVMSTWIKF
jgi:membrane protease YdiL (CAAX protease family)